MANRLKLIVVGLCLTFAGAACSSTQDVPDQGPAHDYASAQDEESATAAGAQDGQADGEAAEEAKVPQATGPVAEVDGEPITAETFNKEVSKIVASGQVPPQLLSQLSGQIVNKIVDKTLIDNAVKRADIKIADEKVDARVDQIRAEFAAANQGVDGQMGSLDTLVAQLGISKEEFYESVRESLAIEQLLADNGMTYPTAEEIRAFYDENPEAFEQPEQVHARHILIKVPEDADEAGWESARKRAAEIQTKASAPDADFAALAAELSEGPLGARNGGDLGWFGRQQMVPEFEKVAFTLEKNAISEPVRTQFGWHIIQKLDHREAGVIAFDKVETRLENKMRNDQVQKALSDLLSELHASQKITLHLENIK